MYDDNDEFIYEETPDEKSSSFFYKLGYRMGSGGKSLPKAKSNLNEKLPYSKTEYVYFGHFPQKVKPRSVTIGASIGDCLYRGSDGEVYYEITKPRRNGQRRGVFFYAGQSYEECTNRPYFRRYSDGQANNVYFRVDPIKWRVIGKENGVLTLMSEDILFFRRFGIKKSFWAFGEDQNCWETSWIRRFLNETFYNTAFSSDEQDAILTTQLQTETDDLGFFGSLGFSITRDKVYLLSKTECGQYGFNRYDLKKHANDFNGHFVNVEQGVPELIYSCWMTRTANGKIEYGTSAGEVTFKYPCTYTVSESGTIFNAEESFTGVVPVIRIKECDLEVYSDGTAQLVTADTSETAAAQTTGYASTDSSSSSASRNYTPPSAQKPTDEKLGIGRKILYTLLAPFFCFVGLILFSIITGRGSSGNLGGITSVGYLIFSIVMVWKKKKRNFVFLSVVLNIAVTFLACFLLGWIW